MIVRIEHLADIRPGKLGCLMTTALLTHSTENSKLIFPEMKLRGLVPNSYIHASGEYINAQIHECGN
jgi:hypothetical protein